MAATQAKDFLSPQSMLTPGIAGAITTGIAMPLVVSFDLKFKWVAMGIGFLLALLLTLQSKGTIPKIEKAIYCVLNTLVIFSVSVGAGVNVDTPPTAAAETNGISDTEILQLLEKAQLNGSNDDFSALLGIGSAYADPPEPAQPAEPAPAAQPQPAEDPSSAPVMPQRQSELSPEEVQKLRRYLEQMEMRKQQQDQYSKRWSW